MTSLTYRLAEEADRAFVLDSWVDSFRTSYAAGLIMMDDWDVVMKRQVARVLQRPGCLVWVAAHPTDKDGQTDLYGWIAVEHEYEVPQRRYVTQGGKTERVESLISADKPLVHYCYVKRNYRREGIARGLFEAAGVHPLQIFYYTCRTADALELRSKTPRARWKPLIARHPKE